MFPKFDCDLAQGCFFGKFCLDHDTVIDGKSCIFIHDSSFPEARPGQILRDTPFLLGSDPERAVSGFTQFFAAFLKPLNGVGYFGNPDLPQEVHIHVHTGDIKARRNSVQLSAERGVAAHLLGKFPCVSYVVILQTVQTACGIEIAEGVACIGVSAPCQEYVRQVSAAGCSGQFLLISNRYLLKDKE